MSIREKPTAGKGTNPHSLWGQFIFFAILMIVLTAWHLLALRDYALYDARKDVDNLGMTLAQHAARSVDGVAIVMNGLTERMRIEGTEPASIARIAETAVTMTRQVPQIGELMIVDAGGKRLFDSERPATFIGDETLAAAMAFHREQPGQNLRVAPPGGTDQSSKALLLLSQRITDRDGSFGGIVAASLSPEFFQRFYGGLDIGVFGAVSLISGDGILLLRRPFAAANVAKDLKGTGLFRHVAVKSADIYPTTSPIDHLDRLVRYEVLPGYGLIVVASIASSEYLQGWWWQVFIETFAVVDALIIIFILSRRNVRLEDRRRESARLHELLADNVGDIVILKRSDGRYDYVSPASLGILGYTPAEMVELGTRGLAHPEDIDAALATQARLSSEQPVVSHRNRLRRKDGRFIWVEVVCRLSSDEAAGRLIVMTVRDITARIEAERQASAAAARTSLTLQATSDVVFAVDHDWRVTYANSNCLVLWQQREQPLGRTLWEVAPQFLATEFETCFRRVMEDRQKIEVTAEIANLWFKVHATPSDDQDGGIFAFVSDVTSSKLLEAALLREKEAAMAIAKAKSNFMANMSHELRTPLNAVIGFAELIERSGGSPRLAARHREYASDIKASGEHLLGLINEILDYAKMEAGHLSLHRSTVSAAGLVESSVRMMQPRADSANITITVLLRDAPRDVVVDEMRVRQIILNLLSNAIKFTPREGKIEVRCQAANGLLISVGDNGIGIPPEEIDRVMEAFVQVDDRRTRAQEGTGLGLPLSRRLAEMHGGSLSIESTVGVGTTVTLHIPEYRRDDRAGSPPPETAATRVAMVAGINQD